MNNNDNNNKKKNDNMDKVINVRRETKQLMKEKD